MTQFICCGVQSFLRDVGRFWERIKCTIRPYEQVANAFPEFGVCHDTWTYKTISRKIYWARVWRVVRYWPADRQHCLRISIIFLSYLCNHSNRPWVIVEETYLYLQRMIVGCSVSSINYYQHIQDEKILRQECNN